MKPGTKIILIVFLFAQLAFSQNSNISKVVFYPAGSEVKKTTGERIELAGDYVNLKNNSYWVKSGTIQSNNGDVIVNFDKELTVNNIKAIEQVKASYGYIVEIVHDRKENAALYVWIANEKGERDSDDIIIEIK